MRHHAILIGIVVSSAVSTVPTAAAGDGVPEYTVARIGAVLAPTRVSVAHVVSEDGDAVGEIWFSGYRQAFVYTPDLGPMLLPFVNGHPNARAFDVTERDAQGEVVIAGVAADSFYDEFGVAVYWRYSTVTGQVLDTFEIAPLPGYAETFAVAVNNDRKIVGYSRIPGIQPMVHDVATGATAAFDFPATPADVNNAGEVVGGTYRGDLDGNFVNLGVPPGTTGAGLTSISDEGWAAGTAGMPYTDGAGHFVNGVVRHLGAWELLYANSWLDSGNDVNDNGDVVGAMGISAAVRPVLYLDATGQTYLVNDLIAPGEQFSLSVATSINGAGQIAGGYQAAVLTPVGAPGSPGDVNGDGLVDFADLLVVLSSWGPCGDPCPADVDGDGTVGFNDLLMMLANWS